MMDAIETTMENSLQVLDKKEAELQELATKFTGLSIAGLEDREGYLKVREAALRAEREKLEAERRAIELEKAKAEAAERARREEQERIEREAREKSECEQREKEAAERREALRPDREKLLHFASDLLSKAMEIELVSEEANIIMADALSDLGALCDKIELRAKSL